MAKVWDYVFLTRPVLMLPGWSIILLAYQRSSPDSATTSNLMLTMLAATLLYGGVYILNQIFDRETDKINRKLFLLSEGYVSLKAAVRLMAFCFVSSLVLSFYLSATIGFLFSLMFILNLFYSVPLFSFKNKPALGWLINAIGFGILNFLVGWSLDSELIWKGVLYSLPYFLAVSAIYLNTTLLDVEGDKQVNKITWRIRWGLVKTLWVSLALILATLLSAILLKDLPMITTSAVALILSVKMLASKKIRDIVLVNKISILMLSLWAGYFYPWYVAVLIFGFLATKAYYKYRFQMNYPV